MSGATALDPFAERAEPGLVGSAAAAGAVHVLLAAILFFGVRWPSSPPEAIEVELWASSPSVPSPPPVPARSEPEPAVEKPEIALKAPATKPPAKAEPKPAPKDDRPDPRLAKLREAETKNRMMAELAKEQAAIASERKDAELKDLLARQAADARAKSLADWTSRIRAKIRGNIVLPPEVRGNPEALFEVVQLPTGEVLSVTLKRSSGTRGLDEAIERAILKSSPLPKPDRPELFTRSFELRYRPLDL